jgi:hypothetical protein
MSLTPLPTNGEAFLDDRGDGRALRVTWHPEADLVVLSLWQGQTCNGTFRLPVEQVPDLIATLRLALDSAYETSGPRLEHRESLRLASEI